MDVPYNAAASLEHAGEDPPTTLGTLCVWNVGLPGSTRSGENARKKSRPARSPPRSSAGRRTSSVVPGICRRFEDHQHPRVQVGRDLLDGRHHVRKVRVLRLAQRRRHADVDGVERLHHGEVGRGAQSLVAYECGHLVPGHVGNVRLAAIDGVDLPAVEIDADRLEARASQLHGERQADIPEADDSRAGTTRGNAIEQVCVGG